MNNLFTPVIIIGAARSGTNILRDTLCHFADFATWDCDEINPVWRHGNIFYSNDSFPPELATASVTSFIRDRFDKAWKKFGQPKFLVEKTCANSLRVEFVHNIFPDAKFIYIVRDGYDVVASARKRWRGEMEIAPLPYYISKIRNTPISDLPIYGWKFLCSRFSKLIGKTEHLSAWGPQFEGIEKQNKASLEELCALQWAHSVSVSNRAFAKMPDDQFIRLRYENLVSQPQKEIVRVLDFLEVEFGLDDIKDAIAPISGSSIGKGRIAETLASLNIEKIIEPVMKQSENSGGE